MGKGFWIAQGVIASQQQAEQQVKPIVKGVRMKHFWETVAAALIVALTLTAVGYTSGWGALYHLPNPLPRFRFFTALGWLASAENPRWLCSRS